MQMYVHRKKKTANEKDPSAVLGMTKREQGCFHFFIPLRKPTSAPSGHLLPWEGGSVPLFRIVFYQLRFSSFGCSIIFRIRSRRLFAASSSTMMR